MKKIIRSAWEDEYVEDHNDDGFYSEEFRDDLVENGELDPWEAAFMTGWEKAA